MDTKEEAKVEQAQEIKEEAKKEENKEISLEEKLLNRLSQLEAKIEEYKPAAPRYIPQEEKPIKVLKSPEQVIQDIYDETERKYATYKQPEIKLYEEFVRIAKNMGISNEQIAQDIANNMTGIPQAFANFETIAKILNKK